MERHFRNQFFSEKLLERIMQSDHPSSSSSSTSVYFRPGSSCTSKSSTVTSGNGHHFSGS